MSFPYPQKYRQLCVVLLLVGMTSPLGVPFAVAGQSAQQRVQWLSAELNPEGKSLIKEAISASVSLHPASTDEFLLGFIRAIRKTEAVGLLLDLKFSQPDEVLLIQLKARLFGFSLQPPPIQASLTDAGSAKFLSLTRTLTAVLPESILALHATGIEESLSYATRSLPNSFILDAHDVCPMGP
ncbi:MAG: hypothetical protein JNN12_10745 [Bacteroidetes Order II. Incertae sedis bacterium]|nr:hypothetical protein [Bacteroidetes Order II. bacterium]